TRRRSEWTTVDPRPERGKLVEFLEQSFCEGRTPHSPVRWHGPPHVGVTGKLRGSMGPPEICESGGAVFQCFAQIEKMRAHPKPQSGLHLVVARPGEMYPAACRAELFSKCNFERGVTVLLLARNRQFAALCSFLQLAKRGN